MILYEEYQDPAMRYEGLACKAFNDCIKYQDPFSYAAQDHFNNEFTIEPTTLMTKRILSTIFIKLIIDNPENTKLKDLNEMIWTVNSQKEVIFIIDEGIKTLNLLNQ